jgi:hypothetical protein
MLCGFTAARTPECSGELIYRERVNLDLQDGHFRHRQMHRAVEQKLLLKKSPPDGDRLFIQACALMCHRSSYPVLFISDDLLECRERGAPTMELTTIESTTRRLHDHCRCRSRRRQFPLPMGRRRNETRLEDDDAVLIQRTRRRACACPCVSTRIERKRIVVVVDAT